VSILWIREPGYVTVGEIGAFPTSYYFIVNGAYSIPSNACYQEDTNRANLKGTDGVCGLNYSGTVVVNGTFDDYNLFLDGDWRTYAVSLSNYSFIEETYYKPENFTQGKAFFGFGTSYDNYHNYSVWYALPASCFNASTNVNFTIRSWYELVSDSVNYACLRQGAQTWNDFDGNINYVIPPRYFVESAVYWGDPGSIGQNGTNTTGNQTLVSAENHGKLCIDGFNLCNSPLVINNGQGGTDILCELGNVTTCPYGCTQENTTATDYYAMCAVKTCADECNVLNFISCADTDIYKRQICIIDNTTGCYKNLVYGGCNNGDVCNSGSCVSAFNPGNGTGGNDVVLPDGVGGSVILTGWSYGDRLLLAVVIFLITAALIFGGGAYIGADGRALGVGFVLIMIVEFFMMLYYGIIPAWVGFLIAVIVAAVLTVVIKGFVGGGGSRDP
jgi:hypothetical protein